MLTVEVVREWEELLALGAEWEALEDQGGAPTVFQTFAWQSAWIRHLRKGRPWTLVFRDGPRLVGLAPMAVTRPYRLPLCRLQFTATGASDYLDLLALPERRAEVSETFARALNSAPPRWDAIDLQQVRGDSVVLQRAPVCRDRAAPPPREGSPCWRAVPQALAPYAPLPATREEFLKSLGKKTRYNLGYSRRLLEREHEVEVGLAGADDLEREMEAFFRLHQARWRRRWMPGQMAGSATRRFHLEAARGLLRRGRLRLHYLRLDGVTVASLYCFSHAGVGYYYLSGFDPSLGRYGLGTLLTAEAMQSALEEGCREFDFLRGQEGYKYRWGCADRENVRVIAGTPGSRSRAALALAALEKRVADWYEARAHGGHPGGGGTGGRPGGSTQ